MPWVGGDCAICSCSGGALDRLEALEREAVGEARRIQPLDEAAMTAAARAHDAQLRGAAEAREIRGRDQRVILGQQQRARHA
jgi:hypothetical protein